MSADPFERLAAPGTAVEPSAAFGRALRDRVTAALGRPVQNPARPTLTRTNETGGLVTSDQRQNESRRTMVRERAATGLNPYLAVDGAREAIEFYVEVFGAVPVGETYVGDDGRIGHAELMFGDSLVMLADEYPDIDVIGPNRLGGTSVTIRVDVPDAAITEGLAARRGATVTSAVAAAFHGSLSGTFVDPWGHRWIVQTRIEDPSVEELTTRASVDGFALEESGAPAPLTMEPPVTGQSREGHLGYVVIPAPDLAAGIAFFEALFGWEVSEPGSEGGVHLLNANFPGGMVGRELGLTFVTDDLDAAVRRVRELGGLATDADGPDAWRTSACVDDQGFEFTLVQAAPGPYPVGNEL